MSHPLAIVLAVNCCGKVTDGPPVIHPALKRSLSIDPSENNVSIIGFMLFDSLSDCEGNYVSAVHTGVSKCHRLVVYYYIRQVVRSGYTGNVMVLRVACTKW